MGKIFKSTVQVKDLNGTYEAFWTHDYVKLKLKRGLLTNAIKVNLESPKVNNKIMVVVLDGVVYMAKTQYAG